MNQSTHKSGLPKVIILYGPPGCGKGTQAQYLMGLLPDYFHLDFGTEFRAFVKEHLSEEERLDIENLKSLPESEIPKNDHDRALRVQKSMQTGNHTVFPSDLRYIVEKKIYECVERGQNIIMEGPGRLVEEAKWLSGYFASHQISPCIFHLHLSLEDIIPRIKTRYFLPGSSNPYRSYEEALGEAKEGQIPYRRQDDGDIETVIERYRAQYKRSFAKILYIYQFQAKANIIILDATYTIHEVSRDIKKALTDFYGLK
jgi:adenylate kinase family enzyme